MSEQPAAGPDGFTALCHLCDWTEWAASREVAQASSVWHVYEEHPEAWHLIVGSRSPREPDPHTPPGIPGFAVNYRGK